MSFALGRREPAATGLKRRLEAEIGAAGEALADEATGVEARIHAARRRLKRARSILAVLEPELGSAGGKVRKRLRDIAHALADTRDADVLAGTAADLRDAAGPDERPALAALAAALAQRAVRARAAGPRLDEVGARLAAAEAKIAARTLADKLTRRASPADDMLAAALSDAYRDGRKAMAAAEATPDEPHLHDWRKAVKHRWHLTRLAERRLTGCDRTTVHRLDRLAETLGQEHDLAILGALLAAEPELAGGPRAAASAASVVEQRRRTLAEAAFALGSALHREKPKQFRGALATLPDAG